MLNKFVLLLTVVSLVAAVDAFGSARKGPKVERHLKRDGTGDVVLTTDGLIPPTHTALGPGDSVGFTTYDLGSNGGANHNIIVYDDGAIAIGRMGQNETGSDDRGTHYTFTPDGTTWTIAWGSRIESQRSGWSSIGQLADVGGIEMATTHAANLWVVDADRGAGVWSESNTLSSPAPTWPRLAVGGGLYGHSIAAVAGAGAANVDMVYTRTPDAGTTFDIVDQPGIFLTSTSGADCYDIAASGSNVYAVIAPDWDGTGGVGGPDVVLATSTDDGTTWSNQTIYDSPDAGELPTNNTAWVPDGACSIIIDNTGAPHVFFSTYLAIGDVTNNPVTYLSVDAPIYHWSAATGLTTVGVFADPDTAVVPADRDGDYVTSPDAGIDSDGNLYVIFQRAVNELDPKGNYYEHVYATGSVDNGVTWSNAIDATPGTGFDAAYSSVADHVDMYVHFVYNCDDTAGSSLNGSHAANQTAVVYHKIDKTTITSVKEVGGAVPVQFALAQNYPNPFNPSTQIQYSVPKASHVTLKVYDMLGREVATLVNQEQSPGNYQANFSGKNLADGTYFYRLQAGAFSDVHKMMLLK